MDDITGETGYVSVPGSIGSPFTVTEAAWQLGKFGRYLGKRYSPLPPEVTTVLEDLPWE